MTGFFLKRPIMAIVCSAVIVIMGLVAIPILPISQYPQITPPVVTVTAFYLGASPEAVETSVTTPLENATFAVTSGEAENKTVMVISGFQGRRGTFAGHDPVVMGFLRIIWAKIVF